MVSKQLLVLLLLSGFSLFSQSYPDRHSSVLGDAWLSNVKTTSPNAQRGSIHWIRYDLGDTYSMHQSKFWNINHPSYLNAGAQTIIIDYSMNGTDWKEFGRYNLKQCTGSTFYEGESGPDFSGLIARYVLINIINNYGHATISGLSEIKINVAPATVSSKDQEFEKIEISASPNPFSNATTINLENVKDLTNLTYQITDLNGKILLSDKVTKENIQLDGTGLISGMYNCRIIHPSGVKSIQLVVVK